MPDFIKVTDTGLKVASRSEIYEQLTVFAKAAYGNDISLDEGTPFDVFLQMLADSLSTVNGSIQSFAELFSSKELSGNFLDFVVGQRGIVRKRKKNQRVIVTAVIKEEAGVPQVERPFVASRNTIYLLDCLGRVWVNTTQLLIQQKKFTATGDFDTTENYQGTCEFGLMPLDGYDAILLFANNFVRDNGTVSDLKNHPAIGGGYPVTDGKVTISGGVYAVPDMGENLVVVSPSDPIFGISFTFQNHVNAYEAVIDEETDAQLRARYDAAVFSNAPSTVEGLRSNLLKLSDYVRIVENFTDSDVISENNPYGLEAHSIWVIVDGGSTNIANFDSFYKKDFQWWVAGVVLDGVNNFAVSSTDYTTLTTDITKAYKFPTSSAAQSWLTHRSEAVSDKFISSNISTDASDITIAQNILNYKSLGCGVSLPKSYTYVVNVRENGSLKYAASDTDYTLLTSNPLEAFVFVGIGAAEDWIRHYTGGGEAKAVMRGSESDPQVAPLVPMGKTTIINGEKLYVGDFMVEIPVETVTAQIPFTRLVNNSVSFNIVMSTTVIDELVRQSVAERISIATQVYVGSLQPGDVITTVGIVNAIRSAIVQYDVDDFDVEHVSTDYEIGNRILIYQKAVGGSATVTFDRVSEI